MENSSRRQFLTDMLHGLGIAMLACVPGTFFNSRKAWSQVRRVTPTNPTVSTITTIKSAMEQTTPENVIQVLQTSKLVPEEKLAVLAVQQLSPDEITQSLNQIERFSGTIINQENCGGFCGKSCGTNCGDNCGTNCGNNCIVAPSLAAGAFCGGGCNVRPGVIGVIDSLGKLGINFAKINTQSFQRSIKEALKLVP